MTTWDPSGMDEFAEDTTWNPEPSAGEDEDRIDEDGCS